MKSKKLLTILTAANFLLIVLVGTSFSQERGAPEPSMLSAKLKSFEDKRIQIESHKLVREGDFESIERDMHAYAEAMKNAFDAAIKQSKLAADSKGKTGKINAISDFENLAKSHEARVNAFATGMDNVIGKIKSGGIMVDRPLLQKLTPGQMNDFKRGLQPRALKLYQQRYPEIPAIKGQPEASSLRFFETGQMGAKVEGLFDSLMEGVGSFFVGTAEASIAGPCAVSCYGQNWYACGTCIVGAGAAGIKAYDDYVNCKNHPSCHWYSPPGCSSLWKWWCLAKFIAKLA